MLLHASLVIAQVLLALAMVCAAIRLMRGPRAQDRVLALDTLYVNAMLLMLTFGMREASTLYFEAALVIAHARLRVDGGARQVPAARRGDRMSHAAEAAAVSRGAGRAAGGARGRACSDRLDRSAAARNLLRAHPSADHGHDARRRGSR